YLVRFAYGVHPKQVIRAPAWIEADKFDITAKPDMPGSPSFGQIQSILQKLLAERFGLVFHKEKRELSAYTITVAKGGEKIRKDEAAPVPDIFAAMEQQLGLHIQKTKAQVDVMVIDKVSKPSENGDRTGCSRICSRNAPASPQTPPRRTAPPFPA
ncbi:MAG TPA: TIGR03435 family protein, partial [Bryobacteraceae bacterium]|nr:TIGR03435 family protein [Bryobacteraceae bacterium]